MTNDDRSDDPWQFEPDPENVRPVSSEQHERIMKVIREHYDPQELTVRLPQTGLEALEAIAERRGLKLEQLVRGLLMNFADEHAEGGAWPEFSSPEDDPSDDSH